MNSVKVKSLLTIVMNSPKHQFNQNHFSNVGDKDVSEWMQSPIKALMSFKKSVKIRVHNLLSILISK
jgi:hypothetical protein